MKMPIVESYGYEVDTERLPEASLAALVKKGLGQVLGNAVSAGAVAAEKAFRPVNGEVFDRSGWIHNTRQAVYQKILGGKLGERASGPRIDPVQKKFAALVDQTAKAGLKNAGYKWPTDEDSAVDFGNGTAWTRQQLRDAVVKNAGDRLIKEAQRLVASESRATNSKLAEGETFNPAQLGA